MNGADELLRLPVRVEHDIFVVRQRGREIAAELGMEGQDQVRVATSLSEVAREMLRYETGAVAVFRVRNDPDPTLCIEVSAVGSSEDHNLRSAVAAVSRLMDGMEITETDSTATVSVTRRLPSHVPMFTAERIEQLREVLTGMAPGSPLDELNEQNLQLLSALEEVQRQRDELLRLNAELAETNRGVMALYTQLSEELEETNRGVVALYAELDERSAQLREANEAKSRFLANVSHELRAPVTAIIGLSRLIVAPGGDALTEEQVRQIELIQLSGTDLLTLVNDLLNLAKAESGRLEPQFTDVDLRVVLGQLRGTLRGLATKPDVELVVDDCVGLPPIRTDETMLTQVLRNLVSNGLKFTEQGTVRLTATLTGDGQGLAIEIADTGIGIPADQQERIFEEFYQVPGAIQAQVTGTGLGLPYVRRLVGLLGGELTLTSTAGEGSSFVVTLPVRGGTATDPAEAPVGTTGASSPVDTGTAGASSPVDTGTAGASSPGETGAAGEQLATPAGGLPSAPACDPPISLGGVFAGGPALGGEALGTSAPLGSSAPIGSSAPLGSIPPRPVAAGLRVLVVDDDPYFRRTVCDAIRPDVAELNEAGDGRSALAEVARNRPDVIFVDLRMPELDGAGVLAAVKGDDRLRDIPVIVVTAAVLDATARTALAQAYRVLDKTEVTGDALRSALRSARPGGY